MPLCAAIDKGFEPLSADATSLNRYAVEMRYDDEFWPSQAEVEAQLHKAETIVQFVRARLPREWSGPAEAP